MGQFCYTVTETVVKSSKSDFTSVKMNDWNTCNRGSNSNTNKKITDYSSRRCEILTNIQELQILQNEAKTVEEKEACQKGVMKNIQDLKNLNVQEQANWFQDVT